MRSVRFPSRYFQAPDALNQLGQYIAELGSEPFTLIDDFLFDAISAQLSSNLSSWPGVVHFERHRGETTDIEINRATQVALQTGSNVVIGIGGGKALDTAKIVANNIGAPLIVVPSIAASDAPCSALSVVYGEDGKVDRDVFLPRNPDLVLVDTCLISSAPSRFLSAGIGDALATWYEADACRQSGAKNCLGTQGAFIAYDIGRQCLDVIREYGKQALIDCDNSVVSEPLERVIEANILSSCIGFESGGVAAAHAIHHGLAELADVHGALHGEKVAIGVLASLLMKNDSEGFEDVRAFCQSVNLPTTLAEIGLTDATDEKLHIIAQRACRPGEIFHNEPFAVSEDMVISALKQLDEPMEAL